MGIPAILAGILTQLALYSINLKIMGLSLIHIYTQVRYTELKNRYIGGTA